MAAINENIHLNSVYFPLRRKHDILLKNIIINTSTVVVDTTTGWCTNNNRNDDNDYDNLLQER